MSIKQYDDETPDTPDVHVYWYESGKYWVVEIDTPIIEGQIDNTRVYVNGRLVRGW